MKAETLAALNAGAGRPLVRAVERATGEEILIDPSTDQSPLGLAAAAAARTDASGESEIAGLTWFLEVHNPPLSLVLVGAVHIAQALAPMAMLAGYRVTVIDPRAPFATQERFPGCAVRCAFPDEVLKADSLGTRSALVALAHDPKIDDPGLVAALNSACFYVGALGSRKSHAARLERLKSANVQQADLTRIQGPVGLAIGARSPGEIAVSILAQMTAVLRL
jgi:xanthine dehydrogenase accessory factor